MDVFVTWLIVILICSIFLAVLGHFLFTTSSTIQIRDEESYQSTKELTILDWFQLIIRQIRRGNLPKIKLVRNVENEQTGSLKGFSGKVAAPEKSADEITDLLLFNVNLSMDIPAGKQVQVIITTPTTPIGIPNITVQDPDEQNSGPILVQMSSTRLSSTSGVRITRTKASASKVGPYFRFSLLAFLNRIPLAAILFGSSIAIYLVTRIIGLDRFPIYFFTDEAIHTILAEELVNNHFRFSGVFLPTYFPMGASFGLNSISVYLQVIPYLLFGKSVIITRLVSVIITTFGAISVALILKDFFKLRYWWSGVLLLSIVPTWFLHSRTAFEYAELAAFYAIFLYFYLSYRLHSPRYLFLAIIAGACVFYTHGLGEFLMGITALLLLLVDFKYHWEHRKTVIFGLLLIIILALPYYRFTHTNPTVIEDQLRMRGSYWLDQNLSISQKFIQFGKQYLTGLNPVYWFVPNNPQDLIRHTMKGYGHLWIISLPFFLIGLLLVFKNIRSPAYRVILIALIASPFGAALAQISVLRVLWFVIPATVTMALGLELTILWLSKKHPDSTYWSLGLFAVLIALNVYMFQDALRNGPIWYQDYSLYGMQYGAKQVFGDAIPAYMNQDPDAHFVVTPTWANGTDNFVRFFLTPEQQSKVKLDSIQAYLFQRQSLDDHLVVVLTKPELEEALASPKFKQIQPLETINYPDGTPGFYFIHLAYVDNADEIFAAEKLARSQPIEAEVKIDDQIVKMVYSRTDMGQPESIFDGDVHTLIRGLEANPFEIDLEFPEPRSISKIAADFANMDFTLTGQVYGTDSDEPVVYQETMRGATGDPHIEINIDKGPGMVRKLHLEILSLNGGEQPHIHVRELKLIP